MDEITKHPIWKQAVDEFLAADFQPEELIPFDWFYNAFRLEMPKDDQPITPAELKRIQLRFLANFERLQNALLADHQIDLVNVRGAGYSIVGASDQTEISLQDAQAEIRKTLRRLTKRLVNVKTEVLTSQERAEHSDALARLSQLRGMSSIVRRLPKPG